MSVDADATKIGDDMMWNGEEIDEAVLVAGGRVVRAHLPRSIGRSRPGQATGLSILAMTPEKTIQMKPAKPVDRIANLAFEASLSAERR